MEPLTTPHLFRDARQIRALSPGVYSGLRESESAAAYDRKAAIYDAVVGWPPYHRIVWGTSAARYGEFARSALAAAGGDPFAEIGCGSLLFTAEMYREARTGTTLVSDRSLEMLRRAAKRLASHAHDRPARPIILHADAVSLPLLSSMFSSVLMLNLLHVPIDRTAIIAECGRLLIPREGRLFATCLVKTGRWSDAAMHVLHRAGELGLPLTRDEALDMMIGDWGLIESCEVEGNMTFVVVRHAS